MEKPILSPDFTIEDIHKLREYNHYLTKDMTPQERRDYYNKRGMEVHRQIQEKNYRKHPYNNSLGFIEKENPTISGFLFCN